MDSSGDTETGFENTGFEQEEKAQKNDEQESTKGEATEDQTNGRIVVKADIETIEEGSDDSSSDEEEEKDKEEKDKEEKKEDLETKMKAKEELANEQSNTSEAWRKNYQPAAGLTSLENGLSKEKGAGKDGAEASDDDDDDEEMDRQIWDNPIEFIFSCISMSVGLGNIWRFPTTAYENGGGAFLIPYLIVLLFIGRPMYFLEMSIGQFSSRSAVKVWKMLPAFKGIGYGQAVASWSVVTYYCSIIAISIFYLIKSFAKVLPWSVCDPAWADDRCVNVESANASGLNSSNIQTSAEQYFQRFVLNMPDNLDNGPGLPDWRLVLCLAASWLIMVGALFKGVKSSGKVAYLTALFPYLGLIVLLIKGCTLPGASEGILYFITPQWEKLLEAQVWYAAVGQSFFSLSVSFGCIVMFSSHNKFRQNIYRDATIISLMDTFTSLLGGFTIFSCLGYLKYALQAENFDDVVSGGTTLVFVLYPTALASFGGASQVFSVLFFLMLITLGVGSSTALIGMVITLVSDKVPSVPKWVVTIILCAAGFLFGLIYVTPGGQWILDMVDFFGGTLLVYVLAIAETIAVFWIFGYNRYFRDIRFMIGVKLGFYWKFCLILFIPIFLIVVLIYTLVTFSYPTYDAEFDGMEFPAGVKAFGWVMFAIGISALPISYFHEFMLSKVAPVSERLKAPFHSSPKYGPRLKSDRRAWEMYTRNKGWQKMDYWKDISKEALETPQKLKVFNGLYDNAQESCSTWDSKETHNSILRKIPFFRKGD